MIIDPDIIKGCCASNEDCQKQLYEQYSGLFLKVCSRYAKDFQEAEQLLQDGFLKIFTKIESYKHKGSFEGWMRRIMVNTCLDYLRSKQKKHQQQVQFSPDIGEALNIQNNADALVKIELDDLINLIQSLSPTTKAVFNLFVFDGFSHREIAAELSMSEGTSQWHVNNARKILQHKLAEREKLQSKKVTSLYGQSGI